MKCPHCGIGEMIKRPDAPWRPYGYWDCDNCGRGWYGQSDGTMISQGATDQEIYDPKTGELKRVKLSSSFRIQGKETS